MESIRCILLPWIFGLLQPLQFSVAGSRRGGAYCSAARAASARGSRCPGRRGTPCGLHVCARPASHSPRLPSATTSQPTPAAADVPSSPTSIGAAALSARSCRSHRLCVRHNDHTARGRGNAHVLIKAQRHVLRAARTPQQRVAEPPGHPTPPQRGRVGDGARCGHPGDGAERGDVVAGEPDGADLREQRGGAREPAAVVQHALGHGGPPRVCQCYPAL